MPLNPLQARRQVLWPSKVPEDNAQNQWHDLRECLFEGRTHGIVNQKGWQEVADYALAFVDKYVK